MNTSTTTGGATITGGGKGAGPGPRLMTAETLQGNTVVNKQDESLGQIDSDSQWHRQVHEHYGRTPYWG